MISVRINQLYKAADHFSKSNRVTLIEVLAELKISVDHIAGLHLTKLSDKLSKIVGNKVVKCSGRNFGISQPGI